MKRILITGGAGFIGSHVANLFHGKYPDYKIFVLDLLTYAANPEYLNKEIPLFQMDIGDINEIKNVLSEFEITDIIHLAAESHVDNSIKNPGAFIQTNIVGTHNLLKIAYEYWKDDLDNHRFYHVSTDEVYGSLGFNDPKFTESTPYDPRSPYSASKASSDHLVRSYNHTYGLNVVISNCSNNYGPHQHEEKLIPKVISNVLKGADIPVYGTGENIRDWLWVGDHADAIDTIFHSGKSGETYNIGGNYELNNLDLVKSIIDTMGGSHDLIKFVTDRAGHDLRYAINTSKIKRELGWEPKMNFEEGIKQTIEFYKNK